MKSGRRLPLTIGLALTALILSLTKRDHRKSLRKIAKGVGIVTGRLQEQGIRVLGLWIQDHALRRIQGISPANTSRINPQLYVGGQQYRHGLERMADLGIAASLSLRQEVDDTARGVALERHLWLPTVDDTPPTLEQLDQAVQFTQEIIADGKGIYIHCGAGVGRAPTTAAAYLVSTGLAPAEAWEMIHQVRPFIRPKASQLEQIERYYQEKQRS